MHRRRNLELKAHDPDPAATLALGATDAEHLTQRDTYFTVAHGRLKLREQTPGGAELIQYARADTPAERESAYRLVFVPDPAALSAALDAALGVDVIVEKRRHLLLWERVRIHLDAVEGLGTFVELEAVLAADEEVGDAQPRIDRLRTALRISDARLEARGYAQQLLSRGYAQQLRAQRASDSAPARRR